MATVRTCADCSTQYALDLSACPHCGSSNYATEKGAVVKQLPLFVNVACIPCGRGPWVVRLPVLATGLVQLPTLACTSCGNQVPVTWPPEEEPMSPKITTAGGATNARATDRSPAVEASEPQVAAEGDLGLTNEKLDEVQTETVEEVDEVQSETKDYEGMTLAELREEATSRKLPSYGTKAQLTERLREADAA